MTVNELDEPWATDPLALRLSRIQDPPVSKELLARVLSGAPALRRRTRIRRIHVLIGLAGVAVLAGVLAATPAGAMVGRAVLPHQLQQRFGIMVGAPQTIQHPGPSSCAVYPGAPNTTTTTFTKNGVTVTQSTRTCKDGRTITSARYEPPVLDLDHAQGLVSFRIRTASWIPPGLQSAGVRMYPSPDFASYDDKAAVLYQAVGASGGSLTIDEQPGLPAGGTAVPSSAALPVLVNGHLAFYVHGSYGSKAGGPARWDPNTDVVELSWQADGLTFHMTAAGLRLSQSDAIRIAESVG